MNMYDMTMCTGGNCPRKLGCLRFIGEPAVNQEFFGIPPLSADMSCLEHNDAQTTFRNEVDKDETEKLAYGLSTFGMSRDETIWLLARVQLETEHLSRADYSRITGKKGMKKEDKIELKIKSVEDEEIQIRAYYISLSFKGSNEDLHWFIAQQHLVHHMLHDRIKSTLARYMPD
ncbi:MAG: hypothetical protein JW969_15515 [Spirochaetales bacterium]|nr:hypothetical protein [Spirochaetales bacterium]